MELIAHSSDITRFIVAYEEAHTESAKENPRLSTRNLLASEVPCRNVIVIVAGIAAARALSHHWLKLIVIEARGRLGGGIATDCSLGSPVDLGACFIYCSYGNPLSLIGREEDFRTYSESDAKLIFQNDGRVDTTT